MRRTSFIRTALALVAWIAGFCGMSTAADTHVVARGETLTSIAEAHGVTVEQLTRANNISESHILQPEEKLVLPGITPAFITHTVRRGDTLSSIAASYGVSVQELARANHLRNADLLQRGQTLKVPRASVAFIEHRVQRGETVASIASRYGVTTVDLVRANDLSNANLVRRGQTLRIPLDAMEGHPQVFIEHTVRRGDTLSSIASRYHTTISVIEAANPAVNPRKLAVDQTLNIPVTPEQAKSYATKPPPDPRQQLPTSVQAAIDKARVERSRWKHIVIHHSATNVGSGKGIDRYHREDRGMENGLAYHFVIGNGNGMGDGEIFVGQRWAKQIDGGHLVSSDLNHNSIGICLIGDFEKRPPSSRQLDRLEALIRALLKKTGLSDQAVTTHTLIHPGHTRCPGRHFPTEKFKQRLRNS